MEKNHLSWPALLQSAGKSSLWLHSSRLLPWQKKIVAAMRRRLPNPGDMLWILSSGTQSTNTVKAIGLRYEAVLASAAAVNAHLEVASHDHWLVALPTFHVGGLGILARAFLSGSRVSFFGQWNAKAFVNEIRLQQCTLTSLVPTQVHDLVIAGLVAPKSLRAVVVGGGALQPELYFSARALGWPLLPSYGLTECASQVATATLLSLKNKEVYPALKVMPHVKVEAREGLLHLQSSALCHWVATGRTDGCVTLEDPLRGGWLPTEDLGDVVSGAVRLYGRDDDVVKVLGELVPLSQVEYSARRFFFERGLKGEIAVLAAHGGRAGNRLVMVTDTGDSLRAWQECLTELNSKLPGPMRLEHLAWVVQIPRGDLGKVKKATLRAWIGL